LPFNRTGREVNGIDIIAEVLKIDRVIRDYRIGGSGAKQPDAGYRNRPGNAQTVDVPGINFRIGRRAAVVVITVG
jgi:hypothetical protein